MGKVENGSTRRTVAKQASHLLCKQRMMGAQRGKAEAHAALAPVLSYALVWLKLEKPPGHIKLHNQSLFYNTQRDHVKVTRHL